MNNILTQLDTAVYLTEEESLINPREVYLREYSPWGVYIAQLNDVVRLAEQHKVSYSDAEELIAEAYHIPYSSLVVEIREDTIISHPELISEVNNIVVTHIPDSDPVSLQIEETVNSTLSGNDSLVSLSFQEEDIPKALAKLNRMRSNLTSIAESKNHSSISCQTRSVAKEITSVINKLTK